MAAALLLMHGPAQAGEASPASQPAALQEFASRVSRLTEKDVAGRVALAQWALGQKLFPQAAEQATLALLQDDSNRPAALILQNADAAQAPAHNAAKEAALCGELEKRLGHPFKARDSTHYVIYHDGTEQFAATRADLMERAYRNYLVHCTFPTLRPARLSEPMVVLLFKDRKDYAAYLADVQIPDIVTYTGVYLPSINRSIFYDETTNPSVLQMHQQWEKLRQDIQAFDAEIQAAPPGSIRDDFTKQRAREISDAAVLHGREVRTAQVLNDLTTYHEAAHQFAFNTGLQRLGVAYPKWLAEGFACGFEMQNEIGAHGPAVINWERFAPLKEEVESGKLPSIRTVIAVDFSRPVSARDMEHLYCEGWALVHYLYKYQRSELEKLMQAYNALPPGKPLTPQDHLQMFKQSIGDDIPALDAALLAYLRRF
jgi:hypothetical protein